MFTCLCVMIERPGERFGEIGEGFQKVLILFI